MIDEMVTLTQAAAVLALNRRTVAKLIRQGELRGALYAGRWRISRQAILDFQQAQEAKVKARIGVNHAREAES